MVLQTKSHWLVCFLCHSTTIFWYLFHQSCVWRPAPSSRGQARLTLFSVTEPFLYFYLITSYIFLIHTDTHILLAANRTFVILLSHRSLSPICPARVTRMLSWCMTKALKASFITNDFRAFFKPLNNVLCGSINKRLSKRKQFLMLFY